MKNVSEKLLTEIVTRLEKLEKRVIALENGPNKEWIEYYKDAPGPRIYKLD